MKRLMRPRGSGKVGGVCAGLAEYFSVDVSFVRALWLVLSIVPGAIVGGLIAYLLAWLIIPEGPAPAPTERARLTRSRADARLAGVCGGLAEYFHVDSTPIRLLWIILTIWPGCLVGGIFAYLVAWLIVPAGSPTSLSPRTPQAEADSAA